MIGFFVQFARPLPIQTYAKPTPRKGSKRKAATNRKNRAVQLVKKAKAKKVKWAKPPKYTPEQLANIERMFRRGRGENKFDNWAGVPL